MKLRILRGVPQRTESQCAAFDGVSNALLVRDSFARGDTCTRVLYVSAYIVGLVYNYRNSLSEDFTGDAKTFYNDENCVISAEIIWTSAEKPVNVIDKANFGVKYII